MVLAVLLTVPACQCAGGDSRRVTQHCGSRLSPIVVVPKDSTARGEFSKVITRLGSSRPGGRKLLGVGIVGGNEVGFGNGVSTESARPVVIIKFRGGHSKCSGVGGRTQVFGGYFRRLCRHCRFGGYGYVKRSGNKLI